MVGGEFRGSVAILLPRSGTLRATKSASCPVRDSTCSTARCTWTGTVAYFRNRRQPGLHVVGQYAVRQGLCHRP